MRSICCGYLWLALLGLVHPTSRAWAQSDETAPQTAQDWFERGVALSRAAQWPDARAAYLRSLDLEPRVSTYFNLATASWKLRLGRATLLALDDFAALADPRLHAEFLAEAARMRAEALDLTGTVVLTGLRVAASVEVDDEARRWPLGPEPEPRINLDPGHHVLVLRAPSYLTRSLEVDVARGVTTRLSPALSAVHADVTPRAPAPPARSETKPSPDLLLWGGAVALGLGAVVTVLVLTLRSEADGTARAGGGSLKMVFD